MAKMHEDELDVNEALVHHLLKKQAPQWADLPISPIASSGSDHALYRLGDDFVIRLPRIGWATKGIEKEYEWVPKIANLLKTPLSKPLFKGQPDDIYPNCWLVTPWQEGNNPDFEHDNEYAQLAKDLATFLNTLHGIQLPGGPPSRRGVPLKNLNADTTAGLKQLEDEVDVAAIGGLWDKLIQIPMWQQAPVWVHGDFLPGNIITQNNRLNAVIDFSDVGMGDPACDCVIAWALFNAESRKIFRENLENIDDNTWERGRGWALSIALIMLPYYKTTNPYYAKLARRIIKAVSIR